MPGVGMAFVNKKTVPQEDADQCFQHTCTHTYVCILSDSVCKVMCAHALCVALFAEMEREDFVGKMWQVHGKCGKDHTKKLFGK